MAPSKYHYYTVCIYVAPRTITVRAAPRCFALHMYNGIDVREFDDGEMRYTNIMIATHE